ncbi:MAG: metalloregulator ArsR/SmtB family transcription factor [Chloroflexota bacterium]
MEFVSYRKPVTYSFTVSLPAYLFTIPILLEATSDLEGTDEWIAITSSALSSNQMQDLRNFSLLSLYCAGFWREIFGGTNQSSVDDLVKTLDKTSDSVLWNALRSGLADRIADLSIRDNIDVRSVDSSELTTVLGMVRKQRVLRGAIKRESDTDIDNIRNLLESAALVRDLLSRVMRMTSTLISDRIESDLNIIRQAVANHQRRSYPSQMSSAFEEITGRHLPEAIEQPLSMVDRVVFTPVRYIGPYFLYSRIGSTLYIAIEAHTSSPQVDQRVIAALYPPMKALADANRLQMVNLLALGEMNVSEIAQAVGVSHSTASRHLSLLAASGLVSVRREVNSKIYELDRKRWIEMIGRIERVSRV